mgnify:CR=1 FL=1
MVIRYMYLQYFLARDKDGYVSISNSINAMGTVTFFSLICNLSITSVVMIPLLVLLFFIVVAPVAKVLNPSNGTVYCSVT